jgi:hypothetical protein
VARSSKIKSVSQSGLIANFEIVRRVLKRGNFTSTENLRQSTRLTATLAKMPCSTRNSVSSARSVSASAAAAAISPPAKFAPKGQFGAN